LSAGAPQGKGIRAANPDGAAHSTLAAFRNPTTQDVPMTSPQTWNAQLYDTSHSFVWQAGEDILRRLAPAAGERILDVGCGTGHLTARLAEAGATVIGIDSSEEMIASARAAFPAIEFHVMDARTIRLAESVDAIFSNAALHWIPDAGSAIRSMRGALRMGGRLVLEMGGYGNIATIYRAVQHSLDDLGIPHAHVPKFLYFPSIAEYTGLLEANGFEPGFARLFDRPTVLDGGTAGLRNWVTMFKRPFLDLFPLTTREDFFRRVEDECRVTQWDGTCWRADYRRLQVVARAV